MSLKYTFMMKKKYPKIPLCCTAATCGLIVAGIPFLPFIRILEDSFSVAMMTKNYSILKKEEIKNCKGLQNKLKAIV